MQLNHTPNSVYIRIYEGLLKPQDNWIVLSAPKQFKYSLNFPRKNL